LETGTEASSVAAHTLIGTSFIDAAGAARNIFIPRGPFSSKRAELF
jgi:hypothetical protein